MPLMRQYSSTVATFVLAVAILGVGLGVGHANLLSPRHIGIASAPYMSSVGAGYPIGADNGTDIWASTGATTVLTAPINATTSGSPDTIIPAIAGKKIHVMGYWYIPSAAGTIQWKDSASNVLAGAATIAASQMVSVPSTKWGIMDGAAGASITLVVTGTTQQASGTVTYYYY